MAKVNAKIVKKNTPQHERRCPACRRTFQKAIDEQLAFQTICELEHCAFKAEISNALGLNNSTIFVSKYCNQCGKPFSKPTSKFCSNCGKKRKN